jgi:hypothetical protein
MCHRLFVVILLINLVIGIAFGKSAFSQENEIVPGEGIADVRLNQHFPLDPAELQTWRQEIKNRGIDVEISGEPPQVTKINTVSPNYPITGNRIRVDNSRLDDIIRFYGAGQKRFFRDEIVMSYPDLGIEFAIDSRSLVIKKISVFNKKSVKFKIDSKSIDRFQKVLKQSK